MSVVRGMRKRVRKDSFMMIRGFPVALRLTIKSSAALEGITMKKWLVDACIMKIARGDRREK